jgi:hypothetical protein
MPRAQTSPASGTPDPAGTLAWEGLNRGKAAIAAGVAAVFTIGGGLYHQAVFSDLPVIGVLQALTPALDGRADSAVSPRTVIAQFLADHLGTIMVAAVLTAIGALAAGYALWFLLRATIARRPEVPAFARWVVIFGAVAYAACMVLLPLLQGLSARSFIDGTDRSRDAINSALGGLPIEIVGGISIAGQLAFALSFVLVCINAMRTGLLTRFMGVLGLLVGALYVIQFGNLPVVQAFWLGALVPLFLAKWPNGNPPAWASGKAEPWPSSAQIREQRMQAKGQADSGDVELRDEEPTNGTVVDPVDPAPAPRPSANRKRRKRR